MKIQKGQEIIFEISEASAEIYKAEVYLIGNAIEENRTIRVHGHLKDISEHNFLTGMFVNATIITSDKSALSIPTEALVSLNNSSYLLILESTKDGVYSFTPVKVETGDTYMGYTGINNLDDLPENPRILTKGAFTLMGE